MRLALSHCHMALIVPRDDAFITCQRYLPTVCITLGINYSLIYGFVFVNPFIVVNEITNYRHKVNVAAVYAAHLHVPRSVAMVAYCLLLLSLILLA